MAYDNRRGIRLYYGLPVIVLEGGITTPHFRISCYNDVNGTSQIRIDKMVRNTDLTTVTFTRVATIDIDDLGNTEVSDIPFKPVPPRTTEKGTESIHRLYFNRFNNAFNTDFINTEVIFPCEIPDEHKEFTRENIKLANKHRSDKLKI